MPGTMWKMLGVCLFLGASAACAPGMPTADLDALSTAIAQSLTAAPSLTAASTSAATETLTPVPELTSTAEASPTPTTSITPIATPIELFSPTPLLTSTPVVPSVGAQVQVSVPTNCRVGPGTVYERIGGLQVGEVAEVLGRNDSGTYWIIRDPDRPGVICWLWGEYATVTGNLGALPVYTPPPTPSPAPTLTPSPAFDVAFSRLEGCAGRGWWLDLELENRGGVTFRSFALTVRDIDRNTVRSLYADNFRNDDGCDRSVTRDTLPAGDELLVSSPIFTADPRGHPFQATITLCSNRGQSGICTTQSIRFTP